jgi:hypothetical protein
MLPSIICLGYGTKTLDAPDRAVWKAIHVTPVGASPLHYLFGLCPHDPRGHGSGGLVGDSLPSPDLLPPIILTSWGMLTLDAADLALWQAIHVNTCVSLSREPLCFPRLPAVGAPTGP